MTGSLGLEHFAIKWKPVNRNEMRLNKEIEHGFDSIKTQRALGSVEIRDSQISTDPSRARLKV